METYGLQRAHKQRGQSLPTVYDGESSNQAEHPRWLRLLDYLRAIRAYLLPSSRNQLPPARPSFTISNPSPLLLDQLHQDSNYEAEWLWAASQVTNPQEIRYCLERALYINPANHEAQHTLYMLLTRWTDANDHGQGNE